MSSPRIHSDTIQEVKDRSDIYDIISEKVVLKRRGKDFVGLCPFHEEKSPSFTVSPSRQMYYCFGCGAAGNGIKFLMELDKSSFADVVLDLARRYNVPVKTESPEQHQEFQKTLSLREKLYEILAIATSFYQHALRQPQGEAALEYLKFSRRLGEETIQEFQLGYAPAGWETIYGYLVEQKHFPVELVEKAGLIVPRKAGNGYYDRFRDRLIIPIYDIQGRVIGFGGRSLGDEQPKYLNSPETELFDKGRTLFCLDRAKKAISQQDMAVVVEGYFDAIALHAAGINYVVASLGTALSINQIRLLLRYTESKQIILNFDADAAGTKATERAIGEIETLAYRGEVNLRILNLPNGKDADEYLYIHTRHDYQDLLEKSPYFLEWQIHQIVGGKSIENVAESQRIATAMVELLRKVQDLNQRTAYIQSCAEILSQGQSRLIPMLADSLRKQINKPLVQNQQNKASDSRKSDLIISAQRDRTLLEKAEGLLLRIYLHCPEYRQEIIKALEAENLEFSLTNHRFLWIKISEIELSLQEQKPREDIDLISQLQNFDREHSSEISEVSHLFYLNEKTINDIERPSIGIRAATASLEWVLCEKRYLQYLDKWKKTDIKLNLELAEYYQQQLYAEQKRMKELEQLRMVKFSELTF
ncbi:DNA primase [Limnospira maxima CS-328]|uniref:DNA primase n=1 Tax=Limnospira maxima CS-328 TaxID=513049 RepID=B5VU57_LIMMA|nr:DNA primase [Limnospira maxima]EDZ97073.1 DNA primase [Limnospira maxima CS-328]MDC0840501.1 DNA primase [Limnoraphis robusta]